MSRGRANGDIDLLQPIQLPSGKIIDLAKCIAIVPSSNKIDSEMILAGVEQQIPIDAVDLETLRNAIDRASVESPRYTLELRSEVCDLQHRQQVSEWMNDFRQYGTGTSQNLR